METTRTIILQTLTMQNFKGGNSQTKFGTECTTIAGRNGLGKTRHFTAFHWCLFGKDEQGRENYEIKTRINGEIQHRINTAVELELLIDGKPTTLRRELVEKWVRPRGQETEVYKGDETKCFWNGVPVNVTEYKNRVNDIIDADVFKLLTNTQYFINLHWRKQREILMDIVEVPTDAELLQQIDEDKRQALIDIISNKSLEDARKEIASAISKLKEQLAEVQPRIDQTAKMMPAEQDWEALKAEIKAHDKELEKLDAQLADIDAQYNTAIEERRKQLQKQNEIKLAIEARRAELRAEANRKAIEHNEAQQTAANEANAQRRELVNAINNDLDRMHRHEGEIVRCKGYIERWQENIKCHDENIANLRKQWIVENAKQWDGETTCPNCGQQLPDELIANAKAIFEHTKNSNLNAIVCNADEEKRKKQDAERHLAEEEEQLKKAKDILAENKMRIEESQKKLDEIQEVTPAFIRPETPDYDNDAKLASLTAELNASGTTASASVEKPDNSLIMAKKRDIMLTRDAVKAKLETKAYREAAQEEIKRQEKIGREYAQMIADKERVQFAIQQFTKARIASVEASINALFQKVSFQMFAYTNEGNEYEVCTPYIDGQAYGSANTAAQYNATLEICDVLSKAYGICAPIFIEGVESINDPYIPESQCVMLRVTDDAELQVITDPTF